jgi:hypothetical protein
MAEIEATYLRRKNFENRRIDIQIDVLRQVESNGLVAIPVSK